MTILRAVEVGPWTVTETGESRVCEWQPSSKGESTGDAKGVARIFRVTGPAIDIEIADTSFDSGHRDVRVADRGSTASLDDVVGRFRVGVHPAPGSRFYMRLRIPRIGAKPRATQHDTDLTELNGACGFEVAQLLKSVGAIIVNRKELALEETGPTRNQLCVVFEPDNRLLPAVAYAITPVLTFWRQFC